MSKHRNTPRAAAAKSIALANKSFKQGQSWVSQDRLDDARTCFELALSQCPQHRDARAARAAIQPELKAMAEARGHHQAGAHALAAEAYRSILSRRPRYPEVLNNLGVLTLQLGDAAGAVRLLQQAIEIKPELASACANLGAALKRQGDFDAAIAVYRNGIALDSGSADMHFNLGHALLEAQRAPEAIVAYEQALACDQHHAGARASLIHQRRHLCDWRAYGSDESMLRELIEREASEVMPFDVLVTFDDPALQAHCGRQAAQQAARSALLLPPRTPERRERIRIGYLSSDFRRHPVAWLISELIERHDRTRFEVMAYSHGVDDRSAERARLVRGFDRFVEMRGADHDRAAARIRADGIDILVDLNGHTMGSRSGILARRPAPVQIAWLGYPGAMGAPWIDYVLGDAFVTPMTLQPHFAERIVQLPHCFQPSDTSKRLAEPGPTRAECALPERGIVFCCFNNAYKLTPALFAVWMRLLGKVPGAVLWLLEMSAAARANLEREARAHAIDPARLVFASRAPLPEYLARYRLADLFLDTLPYNAGTTANDALWAGLPVLTCAGTCFAARMAGSLLHAAGLAELVTTTLPEYEARALELALDPAALGALRERTAAARRSALFDTARFTRELELAYAHIWDSCLAGSKPAAITASEFNRLSD